MPQSALIDPRVIPPRPAQAEAKAEAVGSFFQPKTTASAPQAVKKSKKKPKPLSLKDLKYKPGSPILRRFWKDGEAFWCGGYEVFDREKLHSVAGSKGGLTTLKPKRSAGCGKLWVIKAGQQGRVATEALDNIRLLSEHSGPVFDFGDVYSRLSENASGNAGVDLTGYVFDEAEDLALAGDAFEKSEELDHDDAE